MIPKPDDARQALEQVRSRRNVFRWIGQVTAGITLAGVGLRLTKPAHAESTQPNCLHFCTGCKVTNCVFSNYCVHSGQGSYFITYMYNSGCQPDCTWLQGSRCSINCSC